MTRVAGLPVLYTPDIHAWGMPTTCPPFDFNFALRRCAPLCYIFNRSSDGLIEGHNDGEKSQRTIPADAIHTMRWLSEQA